MSICNHKYTSDYRLNINKLPLFMRTELIFSLPPGPGKTKKINKPLLMILDTHFKIKNISLELFFSFDVGSQ